MIRSHAAFTGGSMTGGWRALTFGFGFVPQPDSPKPTAAMPLVVRNARRCMRRILLRRGGRRARLHIRQRERPLVGELRNPLIGRPISVRSLRLDANQHRL